MDGNLPISNLVTESESIDQFLFQERLIARFSSFFGVLALALASIGLYGLLSYEVTRRTREIGIRMALGAERRKMLRIVVEQGLVTRDHRINPWHRDLIRHDALPGKHSYTTFIPEIRSRLLPSRRSCFSLR